MSEKKIFVTIASCLMILLLSVGCTDSKIQQTDSNHRQGIENVNVHDEVTAKSDEIRAETVGTPATDILEVTTIEKPKESLLPDSDDIIRKLFENKQSGVQVQGSGIVTRILSDDNDGARHQRFILKLDSGQTLLIAHNIDIAPRVNGLSLGTKVEFYGEYYYTDQGGGIHWTHNDPKGKHASGYLKVQP